MSNNRMRAIKSFSSILIAPCLVLALIFGIFFTVSKNTNADKEATAPTEPVAVLALPEPNFSEPLPTNPQEIIYEGTEAASTEVFETEPAVVEEEETEPEVTEPETVTVYSVGRVNIRSGPGTNYEKLGVLEYGESIERVEVRDDGWSEVIYKDELAYISSDFLSETKPEAQKPTNSNTGFNNSSENSGSNTTGPNFEYSTGLTPEEEEQLKQWVEEAQTCQHCGGEDGPYHRWIADVTCPKCGAEVPANTCHYC